MIEEQTFTPDFLPLLPLKNVIIMPHSIRPIIVGRPSSIKAVEYALRNNKILFVTTQKNPDTENPTLDDVYEFGTKAHILQVSRMSNGALKILIESINRAQIISLYTESETEETKEFLKVQCLDLPTTHKEDSVELHALWRHLKELYEDYAKLNTKVPADLMAIGSTPDDMDTITDTLAVHLQLTFQDRQDILETPDLQKRLTMLSALLMKELDILEAEQRIKSHVQTQVEKNQREYYLTEQIKAIQKELGREDQQVELLELKEKIKTLGLSEEALDKVNKEIKRLEQMPSFSSEAVVSRHYIEWITSLPWHTQSKDTISLRQAESILEHNHAGLKKAKERIIEFLAAKKFSKSIKRSPIICLVGPPGVGKTSLGKSVAESLGREFVRISLGGVRDEAEIRGHRRTYIGALPGKIIQALRKAKTTNPVILLDEIDKISQDIHGDPASALLEVLDPEQNKSFVDHFLEVEYDLSNVMFIATANMFEGIPYPLLDRMEVITLSGYTEDEKVEIARKFLIAKNLEEHDLSSESFHISEKMLRYIINLYTKEAGVRQLERVMAKLMRKTIQVLLKDKKTKSITVNEKLIQEWLGYPKYKPTSLDTINKNRIGLATGLAWTEYGGDVLEIEISVLPGKGSFTLTGQLGDVMQESAQAALSYVRSRSKELGLKNSLFTSKDIHIHIPEGATPKDGPSAGIVLCLALVSALTKNPTKPDIAMTGEITLRGRVLGIGGLKEKLLAARQQKMKTVLIPKENEDDLRELDKEVTKGLDVIMVEHMDEVLKQALEKDPLTHATALEKKSKAKPKKKKPKASSPSSK